MGGIAKKMKRVINIMICSPSDVEYEREKAFQLVHQWNCENLNKNIVLVPIGYEYVAKNFVKKDPQELIKKQIVEQSDMAVVILWTTLGRKDEDGVEYTIGEANEHITADLPLMLFFSTAAIPQNADFAKFTEVMEFKKNPESKLKNTKTGEQRNCMYTNYDGAKGFAEVFRKELDRAIDYFFETAGISPVSETESIIKPEIIRMTMDDLKKYFVFPPAFSISPKHQELWDKFLYSVKENMSLYCNDNYIEFGSYPQNHVVIVDKQSLKCLSSGCDGGIFEDRKLGKKYFKPSQINLSAYATRYFYSDGTKISRTGEHYFQFSPIKWKVLYKGDTSSLLLSEKLLDWNHFLEPDLIETQGNMILSMVEGCPNGTRANNWEWSTLRKWLDTYFVPLAFTEDEQALIIDTTVSNSMETGCIQEKNEAAKMRCSDTKNKAFILSYADMVNPKYGFDPDPMAKDIQRVAVVTDFAIARGVKPSRGSKGIKDLVGWWWLRSPANYKMFYAYSGHKYSGDDISKKEKNNAKEAAQCRVCDV